MLPLEGREGTVSLSKTDTLGCVELGENTAESGTPPNDTVQLLMPAVDAGEYGGLGKVNSIAVELAGSVGLKTTSAGSALIVISKELVEPTRTGEVEAVKP
jgi:hypothetical protein